MKKDYKTMFRKDKFKMNDNSLMPFGIHKGKKMANVPADYLLWIYENRKCYGSVKDYIEENMHVIKEEIKREQQKKRK